MKRVLTISAMLLAGAQAQADSHKPSLIIGNDQNSAENPFVQPQDDALSGGGRDQSLQFGDILQGRGANDVIFGGLGTDLLFGNDGDDVLVGGTEDFNPFNRDRAFGGYGDDAFLWAPGDGSDFFDGGPGQQDTLILGLIGELDGGQEVFQVQNDQNFDKPLIDPKTGLPVIDVQNSPGFCEVIDGSNYNNRKELKKLGLDHLVRFFIRNVADDFADGVQQDDNGLRVTIHLKDTEYLVCTNRDGGEVEVLNLQVSPPRKARIADLPLQTQKLLRSFQQDHGSGGGDHYYENLYGGKTYDSDYYNSGRKYRNTLHFSGSTGWFQTSFGKGRLSHVKYRRGQVSGRWHNQGKSGWFEFNFYRDNAFQGNWGYGEPGGEYGGQWNGQAR
jgi:hypothetical protein